MTSHRAVLISATGSLQPVVGFLLQRTTGPMWMRGSLLLKTIALFCGASNVHTMYYSAI